MDRGLYTPVRRHTSIGDLSPANFEANERAEERAAQPPNSNCPENWVRLPSASTLERTGMSSAVVFEDQEPATGIVVFDERPHILDGK